MIALLFIYKAKDNNSNALLTLTNQNESSRVLVIT